jgi:outer membrane receptor protein involved in Fe transport
MGWVARGFWGRYYQAPPLETVSGPVLDLAASQGFGFLPLHGEKDEEYQFGINVPLREWDVDVSYFRNGVRNFFDHNSLGNSNIFFPLTVDRARIRGLEATVKSRRLWHRAQLALAYSYQRAEGQGVVTGGLTNLSSADPGLFFLDHDQRHTLNAVLTVDLPSHAYVTGVVHYGSGFSDGSQPQPAHLPGHTVLDASVGKSFGKSLSLAVHALNVFNESFLLDNSSTFGGTHWVDPRQVYGEVRYRFHY